MAYTRKFQKIDWRKVDWSLSDATLAQMTLRKLSTVRQMRSEFGKKFIPPINWDTVDWTIPDSKLSHILERPIWVIRRQRYKRGIKRKPGPQKGASNLFLPEPKYDWDSVNWLDRDADIARKLGCSRERVRQVRLDKNKTKSPIKNTKVHSNARRFFAGNLDTFRGLPMILMQMVLEQHGFCVSHPTLKYWCNLYNVDILDAATYFPFLLNWALPNSDLEEIWGQVFNYAGVMRYKWKIGPPKWSRAWGHKSKDPEYEKAIETEKLRAAQYQKAVLERNALEVVRLFREAPLLPCVVEEQSPVQQEAV